MSFKHLKGFDGTINQYSLSLPFIDNLISQFYLDFMPFV